MDFIGTMSSKAGSGDGFHLGQTLIQIKGLVVWLGSEPDFISSPMLAI